MGRKIYSSVYLFKSDSLSIDMESLFCFEQAELGREQVVVIKRPALLSTEKQIAYKSSITSYFGFSLHFFPSTIILFLKCLEYSF